VLRELNDAGIDLGVFGSATKSALNGTDARKELTTLTNDPEVMGDDKKHLATVLDVNVEETEGEDNEQRSRTIIKLRSLTHRSTSGSWRRELPRVPEDDNQPIVPDPTDLDCIANARFSAHTFVNSDFSPWLPFALIMPENKGSRRHQNPTFDLDSPSTTSAVVPLATSTEEDQNSQVIENALLKASLIQGHPTDMKGVFIRRFRWGTVDTLNPEHCDFAALRTAILSTHVKVKVFFV